MQQSYNVRPTPEASAIGAPSSGARLGRVVVAHHPQHGGPAHRSRECYSLGVPGTETCADRPELGTLEPGKQLGTSMRGEARLVASSGWSGSHPGQAFEDLASDGSGRTAWCCADWHVSH